MPDGSTSKYEDGGASVELEPGDYSGGISPSFESRAIVFVALNFIDYALTLGALSRGAAEMNPVWSWVGGYLTMQSFLIKMVIIPFFVITFFWIGHLETDRKGLSNYWLTRYGFTALNLTYLFMVIHNIVTLLILK